MVTELLQIWREQDLSTDSSDKEIVYSAEQYVLLNDPDVQEVLKRCRDYYAPKKHLSKQDLQSILEDIARGTLKRQDYDFKNGVPVTMEPTFQERLQAIKLLQEGADDDNKAGTIQFINNIVSTPDQPVDIPKPNLEAPTEPPANHYSLSLKEPILEDDQDNLLGEEEF